MKNKRLGRGLDALIKVKKDVSELSHASGDAAKNITRAMPMDLIHRGSYQPRQQIDPAEIASLSESIKSVGVIQPIIVREIGSNQYEIVAGERRWRAAQKAGLTEIPAIVKKIDDQTTAAMALIENIQRQDLNSIEMAVAVDKLNSEFALTHQQVAKLLGKSRSAITNILRLLNLANEVKQLVESGQIEMGHARAILSLPKSEQIDLARQIVKNNLTVREVEDKVRLILQAGDQPKVTSDNIQSNHIVQDNDTQILQHRISENLGLPVVIKHKKNGNGQFVLKYKNLEQLQVIIDKLESAK